MKCIDKNSYMGQYSANTNIKYDKNCDFRMKNRCDNWNCDSCEEYECNSMDNFNNDLNCRCEESSYGCSNCGERCNCYEGTTCDFNKSKVENIRTLVRRVFSSIEMESCPVSTAETIINGNDYIVNLEVISKECNGECPKIDEGSKFICTCAKIIDKEVNIANPLEIKINGKEVMVDGNIKDCYIAKLNSNILLCENVCKKGEKANVCVRADGWSIDKLSFEIYGCVITSGKECEYVIRAILKTPIEITDNSVFYTKDLYITEGDFKLCLNPKICIKINSILSVLNNEYMPSIDAIVGLDVVAKATVEKDQIVCLHAIVIN
ncbi:MAG: hypothetical protein ACRC41_05225 [Sarcina sp.]